MPERRDRKPAASSPPTSSLAASREDSHGPGARPERDPPLDRGAADAGQRGRFLGEWVDVGGVIDVEPAAREETLDAPVDGGEQPRHLLVARWLGGVELEAPVFSRGEDAVQQEGVEVDVQLEAAPEALDHRHGAAPPVAHARARRAAAIEPEHGAYGDAEHRAAERMIVGEEIAQAVRQGEHPLAHGNARQDMIDEVGGLLRHTPPATAGTEAASLARERHEALERAVLHRTRAKPRPSAPHVRNSRNSRSTKRGRPPPSERSAASRKNVSRFSRTTRWRTVPSAARGR